MDKTMFKDYNMKIFEFKFDETVSDWIFAATRREAKRFYKKFNNLPDLDDYEIINIPENTWDDCFILDPNEMEPDPDDEDYHIDFPSGHDEGNYDAGLKIIMSFAEYAKENSITDIIATTEF